MVKYHEKDYGSEVVNKFRDYLWGDKRVAENTVDAYCISVRAFCYFTGIFDEEAIKSIDGKVVRSFVEHLRHDEYKKGEVDEELHCVLRSLVQTGMRASETKSITLTMP